MFDSLLLKQKEYLRSKKWHSGLEINSKLIELAPENASLYRDRSLFFRRLKDLESAQEAMKTFLSIECDNDFNQMLGDINHQLKKTLSLASLCSKYKVTASGGFNYGTIEHVADDGRQFFTKISQSSVGNKETYFYKTIRERCPELKKITVDLCNEFKNKKGKITFLTFPKVIGSHASLELNKDYIFSIYRIISGIDAQTLSEYLANDVGSVVSSRQELKLSLIFSQLDNNKVQKQVFKWINKKLNQYSSESMGSVVSDFLWLEKEVLVNKIFERMKDKSYYTMMHGDFHQGNLLMGQDGLMYLIDWPNMGVAPKGVDMTKMFRREKWNFNRIRTEFLDKPEINNNMLKIEKCAFLFAMALTWLNFMPKTTLTNYNDYLGGLFYYMRSEAVSGC